MRILGIVGLLGLQQRMLMAGETFDFGENNPPISEDDGLQRVEAINAMFDVLKAERMRNHREMLQWCKIMLNLIPSETIASEILFEMAENGKVPQECEWDVGALVARSPHHVARFIQRGLEIYRLCPS